MLPRLTSNTTSYDKYSMRYLGPQLWSELDSSKCAERTINLRNLKGYKKTRFRRFKQQQL